MDVLIKGIVGIITAILLGLAFVGLVFAILPVLVVFLAVLYVVVKGLLGL